MPSIAVVTLGCPKNQVDSESLAADLARRGYTLTVDTRRADVILVNTCGFIAPAREESLGELRDLAAAKRPRQLLVAAGCLAELNPGLIQESVPQVDGVLSTRRWHEAAAFLDQLRRRRERLVWTGDSASVAPDVRRTPAGVSAYVKISEGCSGPCAFCTIPSIKGTRRDVVAEVADLVDRGYLEVILVAQDTTAYGRDRGEREGSAELVEAILAAAPSLRWLRLMYAYPQHITDGLIALMAAEPRICHYVDLPLQHAHPEVLRRMRRPADVEGVKRLLGRLREAMPDVAIRTAFIVGYPGETEAQFEALLNFVREMRLDHVGAFTFSPEPGTSAYDLAPAIPEEVKEERRGRLMEAQQGISLEIHQSLVGREMDVLVEGAGDGMTVGRTYRDAPEVDGLALLRGEHRPGRMVRARVVEAMEYDLVMEAVGTDLTPARGFKERNHRSPSFSGKGPGVRLPPAEPDRIYKPYSP